MTAGFEPDGGFVYREIFVPVDNSQHSDWAVDRAIELCRRSGGRITGNHVYAARLHDVRFRQLETGLPAQFQTPDEIKRQRKIHDKLIEKGLQLISDCFLDQIGEALRGRPASRSPGSSSRGSTTRRSCSEVNRGEGRLPGLIGFDPNIARQVRRRRARSAATCGSAKTAGIVAEDEDAAAKLVGIVGRASTTCVAMGAHGLGPPAVQPARRRRRARAARRSRRTC